ncbi:MAG: phosphatase PAP2 family protein [Melioribacteraceae bacterium]|nr:phosphatase PAP2 family protein [Melioribacteraceae bacterium]
MKKIKSFLINLNATDLLVVSFTIFLSLLSIIFSYKVHYWLEIVIVNLALQLFIFTLAYFDEKNRNMFTHQLRFWYLVPMILLVFKELYFLVDPIRGVIYDDLLIKIDRWIFGFDPTMVLYNIANPYLTELLQIVYGTFFFLPIILGISLLRRDDKESLRYLAFIFVLGFFLSYIGYLLLPAIGPRFTLHEFELKNIELPGLFLTEFLEIVNAGESISAGTPNPAEVVQRDAFPSGHTQMTLLTMYLAVKFKRRSEIFPVTKRNPSDICNCLLKISLRS